MALQWDVEAGQVLARHSTGQYGCPLLLFYIQLWQRCLGLTVSNPFHDIECASATSPRCQMPLLAAANKSSTGNQLCNPPMVHSLAVLAAVQGSHAEAVALARGDGCVAVHKLTSKVSFFINPLESLSRSTRSHCHGV